MDLTLEPHVYIHLILKRIEQFQSLWNGDRYIRFMTVTPMLLPSGQKNESNIGRESLLTSLFSQEKADQTLSLKVYVGKCIFASACLDTDTKHL